MISATDGPTTVMPMRILLQENPQDVSEGSRVPFYPGHTNEFLDDAVDADEFQWACDITYGSVLDRLRPNQSVPDLHYRGVDLIWCFKREIGDFLLYALQRYRAIQKIQTRFPQADLVIKDDDLHYVKPRLAQIVHGTPLENDRRIRVIKVPPREPIVSRVPFTGRLKEMFWPAALETHRSRKCTIAVFSDFEKSKRVLQCLDIRKVLFCSVVKSPALWRKLALRDIAYWQAAAPEGGLAPYRDRCQGFLRSSKQAGLFRGLHFGDMPAESLAESKLEELWSVRMPALLYAIDQYHALFQSRPELTSALVDEDATSFRNAFCQVAKQYQVRTFVETHGALGHFHGFIPLTADYICAWGRRQKQTLMEWGGAPDTILVTGCTKYGAYNVLEEAKVRRQLARMLRLDSARPIVLIACQPFDHTGFFFERTIQSAIETIFSAAHEFENAQFIIKLHPADQEEGFYRAWLRESGFEKHATIVQRFDPLLLARGADFLICYKSTYAIDGLGVGKNVILYQDRMGVTCDEFLPYGVFYEAVNKEELVHAIGILLKDPFRKKSGWDTMVANCLSSAINRSPELTLAGLLDGSLSPRSVV